MLITRRRRTVRVKRRTNMRFLYPIRTFTNGTIRQPTRRRGFRPTRGYQVKSFHKFRFTPYMLFPRKGIIRARGRPTPNPTFSLYRQGNVCTLSSSTVCTLLLREPTGRVSIHQFFQVKSNQRLPRLGCYPLFVAWWFTIRLLSVRGCTMALFIGRKNRVIHCHFHSTM